MRTFTIGEVLNRLKDEFDDISISKIRFLESEGLISPDRTDTGYRKFTDDDVARLQYVLRTQRDRYLPLKVIKDELERLDAGLPADVAPTPVSADATPSAAPLPAEPAPQKLFDSGPTDVAMSVTELCEATGFEAGDIAALVDYGLLSDRGSFDGEDLRVAHAAAQLIPRGLEPRHLRMYRQFADRERDLYAQLVLPLVRQRNPDSRRAAGDLVDELVQHGHDLHRVLLGRQLRELLRS